MKLILFGLLFLITANSYSFNLTQKEMALKSFLETKKIDLNSLSKNPLSRTSFNNSEVMEFALEGRNIHLEVSKFLNTEIIEKIEKNNKRKDDQESENFNLRIEALGKIYFAASAFDGDEIKCEQEFNEYINKAYVNKNLRSEIKRKINELSEEFFNYRWKTHQTDFDIPESTAKDKIKTMIKYIDLYLVHYLK